MEETLRVSITIKMDKSEGFAPQLARRANFTRRRRISHRRYFTHRLRCISLRIWVYRFAINPNPKRPQSPKAVPIPRACGIPRFLSIFINSQKSAKYFRKTP
jgi:hypothetical protein